MLLILIRERPGPTRWSLNWASWTIRRVKNGNVYSITARRQSPPSRVKNGLSRRGRSLTRFRNPNSWTCCRDAGCHRQGSAPQRQIEGGWTHYSDPTEIHTTYADMLRGLVWSSSLFDNEELISAVGNAAEKCFQKVPDVGPRSPKIGNACLIALSSISSLYAVSQLGRLKSRARHVSTRKQIARALERAATNAGMTETDLEEIAVPKFGLQEIGRFHEVLGEFTAEVNVRVHGKSELAWIKENGKRQKTVPSSVKTEFNDELKVLKKRIKDIDSLMPSIRFRVEGLFLNERTWPLKDFRQRFLDHPLVGVIARRLIWNFQNIESNATAIWSGDQFIDAGGESVDWIDDQTKVTIWHPLHVEARTYCGGGSDWNSWKSCNPSNRRTVKSIYSPMRNVKRHITPIVSRHISCGTTNLRHFANNVAGATDCRVILILRIRLVWNCHNTICERSSKSIPSKDWS